MQATVLTNMSELPVCCGVNTVCPGSRSAIVPHLFHPFLLFAIVLRCSKLQYWAKLNSSNLAGETS
uniref:Uncharacterized protein n=1 Tax=Arundo donax TaxID=35708 RepID=A0A0A9EG98_ARUDO